MRRLPVLAVLSLTLVAGCGGSSGSKAGSSTGSTSKSVTPSNAAPADYAALLRAAGTKTSRGGSSKLQLTSLTTLQGQQVTFGGAGAFDYAKKTGKLDFSITVGAQAQKIGELITGGYLYVQIPTDPNSYYKVKLSDVAGTSLAQSTDPTSSFSTLAGVNDGVTKVGDSTERGEHTTHYKGTIDFKKAVAATTGVQKQLLQKTFGNGAVGSLPFDAYLDDAGRIRKFVQTTDIPVKGTPTHSVTTIELYDFGTTVTVTAPPASATKDGSAIVGALKSQA